MRIPTVVSQYHRAGVRANVALHMIRKEIPKCTLKNLNTWYGALDAKRLKHAGGVSADPFFTQAECIEFARRCGVDYAPQTSEYYEPVGFHPLSSEEMRIARDKAELCKRAPLGKYSGSRIAAQCVSV